MPSLSYPAGPAAVPEGLTRLSGSYKLRATLSILSILLFFLLYFALVAATGYLFYQAILVPFVPSFGGLLIKAGMLFGTGMLFLFTVKFLFKLRRPKIENRIAIDREREPELWSFVERICEEIGVGMTKRIYIDPDINAYVRYSNFWLSLFFPSAKELTIGLGLVNTLTLSEFKAVIAHEFGHFSQRSMVIGSYIATANAIIFDMIFARDKWDETLERWRGLDFRVSIFAWIITGFAWIIRQILRLFYSFLNLMHASLSREMEFNADKVAVRAAGSDAIVSALWNLEQGQLHWSGTLNNAYLAATKGMHVQNLYDHHSLAAERNAEKRAELIEELPTDEQGVRRYFVGSEVSSIPMYASHPPNDLRETNAKTPYVRCDGDDRSPWILFSDPAAIQQEMTTLLYNLYLEKQPTGFVEPDAFEQFVLTETAGGVVTDDYAGTFQIRPIYFPEETELEKAPTNEMSIAEGFEHLDQAIVPLMRREKELSDEMMTIQQIADGSIRQKEYIRNGVSYKKKELGVAYESIQKEHSMLHNQDFKVWDTDYCALHLRLAKERGTEAEQSLRAIYRQYAAIQELHNGIAGTLHLIDYSVGELQEREIDDSDIDHVDGLIVQALTRLNESIAKLDEITFIPLPNIDSRQELRTAILEKGEFDVPEDSILRNDHLGTIIPELNTALAHVGRIVQKGVVRVVGECEGLRGEG